MNNITKFKLSSTFESNLGGGTLAYPNLSLIEDTATLYSVLYSEKNYMYVEALEDDILVSFKGVDIYTDTFFLDPYNILEYSVDQQTWNTISTDGTATTINTGEKLYFRGECNDIRSDEYTGTMGIGTFFVTKKYNIGGNVMSLLFGDNFEDKYDLTGYDYAFAGLFHDVMSDIYNDEGKLASAENLLLPATTLADSCYWNMFYGCTSLVTAPVLPATILVERCYKGMFWGCTSLKTAPELPATTLADYCYEHMFFGCTSLTTAPELPATTLADYCYSGMFSDCTSLVNSPKLHATTLVEGCYTQMFYVCTSLSTITMLATDISAYDCLLEWVSNITSTGTLYKHPDMNYLEIDSTNGIPEGWTVVDYAA